MIDYRQKLSDMVQQLKAHPKIRIQRVYLSPPAEPHELFLAKQKINMPDAMVQMYEQIGDFELAWQHPALDKDDPDELVGMIRIMPVVELTKQWEDIIWFDFMEDDNFARKLVPFDFFTPEACAALLPRHNDEHTLCYHFCCEDLWPTGLSFEGWFERLLNARGFLYWLEACTVPGQNSPQAQALKKYGPQLFEDFDASLFVPHTAEGGLDF